MSARSATTGPGQRAAQQADDAGVRRPRCAPRRGRARAGARRRCRRCGPRGCRARGARGCRAARRSAAVRPLRRRHRSRRRVGSRQCGWRARRLLGRGAIGVDRLARAWTAAPGSRGHHAEGWSQPRARPGSRRAMSCPGPGGSSPRPCRRGDRPGPHDGQTRSPSLRRVGRAADGPSGAAASRNISSGMLGPVSETTNSSTRSSIA